MTLSAHLREQLRRAIYRGTDSRLAQMRSWALLVLTGLLSIIWKMLIELDKFYGGDFWQAVFGQHPLRDLGRDGLILLAFYVVGGVVWWFVTVSLVRIGAVWTHRMGLRRSAE